VPILSQEYQHQLTLDIPTFKDVLNRMAVFGVESGHQHFAVIKFHISPDTYEMSSVDSHGGEGREETPALSIDTDQEITINFKGHYLQDFARTLPDSSLVILVAEIGKRAKLCFHVHPHMLRHSTGYYLANRGYDTRLVQDYLGHKNIAHTVRYTRTAAVRFEGLWR
jgi:Phage integrase family